jgi:hypothetical protein
MNCTRGTLVCSATRKVDALGTVLPNASCVRAPGRGNGNYGGTTSHPPSPQAQTAADSQVFQLHRFQPRWCPATRVCFVIAVNAVSARTAIVRTRSHAKLPLVAVTTRNFLFPPRNTHGRGGKLVTPGHPHAARCRAWRNGLRLASMHYSIHGTLLRDAHSVALRWGGRCARAEGRAAAGGAVVLVTHVDVGAVGRHEASHGGRSVALARRCHVTGRRQVLCARHQAHARHVRGMVPHGVHAPGAVHTAPAAAR